MLKNKDNQMDLGIQALSSKDFDDKRNILVDKFKSAKVFYKRKLTQSLYWTSLDKDLANQFWRDERWLFGVKFYDIVKLIDHGAETIDSNKGIGFAKK